MSPALSPGDAAAVIGACTELIHRFAWLNDDHRHDELAELFTLDGVFARPSAPEAPVSGRGAIRQSFCERPVRTQRHLVTNILVEPTSLAAATARSAILLVAGPDGLAGALSTANTMLIGEFHDEIVLDTDRWRFRRRAGRLILRSPL